MDFERFASVTTTSTQRSSRRLFMLGLVGVALTAALDIDEVEARHSNKHKHAQKKRRRRNRRRKKKPP